MVCSLLRLFLLGADYVEFCVSRNLRFSHEFLFSYSHTVFYKLKRARARVSLTLYVCVCASILLLTVHFFRFYTPILLGGIFFEFFCSSIFRSVLFCSFACGSYHQLTYSMTEYTQSVFRNSNI